MGKPVGWWDDFEATMQRVCFGKSQERGGKGHA